MLVVVVGRRDRREHLDPGHLGGPDVLERGGRGRREDAARVRELLQAAGLGERDVVVRQAPVRRHAGAVRLLRSTCGNARGRLDLEHSDAHVRQQRMAQPARQVRGEAQAEVEEPRRARLAVDPHVLVIGHEQRRAVRSVDRVGGGLGARSQHGSCERQRDVPGPQLGAARELQAAADDRAEDAARCHGDEPAVRGQRIRCVAVRLGAHGRSDTDAHARQQVEVQPDRHPRVREVPLLRVLSARGERRQREQSRAQGDSHRTLLHGEPA